MHGEVYADLFFLVNFSMDFLCAYLTLSLLRRRAVPWRLISAAVLGGVYAVAALVLSPSRGAAVAADAAVCLAMCALLFWARGVPLRFFALACALFVGVSMAMGGMMTALFNLLNRMGVGEALAAVGEEDGLSAWLFALFAALSTLAGLRGGKLLRRAAARRFARLSVTLCGRSVEVQALVDSGNLCRDPISGRPVIFLEPSRAEALLGDPHSGELARRYRLVPIETVDGRHIEVAYLPDRITLTDATGEHEVRALICPAATLRGAGAYSAIVPSELV